MNQNPLRKVLVLGIIFLFLCVSVEPILSTEIIQDENTDQVDDTKILGEMESKTFLFDTIIDIANNPDINNLLEQYNYDVFNSNFDYKNLYSQLLSKKPLLLLRIIFNKPSISNKYLDKSYNLGIKVADALGESIFFDILESIEITNPEILDELNEIILNDDELSNKINILKEMNNDLNTVIPFEDTPIICTFLIITGFIVFVSYITYSDFIYSLPPILFFLFLPGYIILYSLLIIISFLLTNVFICF